MIAAIKKILLLSGLLFIITIHGMYAQRTYASNSILATGNWYKIAITATGIYKVDVFFLNKLGINTTNLSSASIKLFGNGGNMLPEACNGYKIDDIEENAIEVVDGGDGIFNGNDYFLFYANGPDTWLKDSIRKQFHHQKNLYSNQSFYFITLQPQGKRIAVNDNVLATNTTVHSFNERYFYEEDAINILSSGKDWYSQELLVGASKNFAIPFTNIDINQPATIVSSCLARSVNNNSHFIVSINGANVVQHEIASTGNSSNDIFAKNSLLTAAFNPNTPSVAITYTFNAGNNNAQGWIDWFEIFCTRKLIFNNNQLLFRDWNSVAKGNITRFNIQNGKAAQVWKITNPLSPIKITTTITDNDIYFVDSTTTLQEYIVFSQNFLTPTIIGKIENQNLHYAAPVSLIIITHATLLQQAKRLALYHQQKHNLTTVVVSTEQVFNEFASGQPDPTAIRDFIKMYYDKAALDSTLQPKYVLLFGDASYDYKNRLKNNTNLVPAYESAVSLDPLSTYTSDDYFGFLDDDENINANNKINLLDVGIGRIPAQTVEQAKAFVDKLITYEEPKSLGVWRNQHTFIADDEDANLHFNDAENITAAASASNSLFSQNKIYLDAYEQLSTTAGSRYPAVNEAIKNKLESGTLILNYNGHGSYTRLSEEVIIDETTINTWNNANKLPLLITATCDFAPYDNPSINSLGENILLKPQTGAIALMTTTRLVFAFSNRIMNRTYLQHALKIKANGNYLSLGEAVKEAKNSIYKTQADIINNRKFTLLGDPALTLAFPKYRVETKTINGLDVKNIPDTLKALKKYIITGNVCDNQGNVIKSFNGTINAIVYDKEKNISTKANDIGSYKENFKIQNNPIFKGKSKVTNGNFEYIFIVPKDIDYHLGQGRIMYYAENGEIDANGSFINFLIGGSLNINNDNTGPVIKAYLNDENFLNGAVVNEKPLLLLHINDSSGINITGLGIGHDITVIIDGDPKKKYILNEYWENDIDSYKKGIIHFEIPKLEEGVHTLVAKAWDVFNNSNEVTISFKVKKEKLKLKKVFNYPNPFNEKTLFSFEYNRPNENIQAIIKIFTVSGMLLKTIKQTINTPAMRSNNIQWDMSNEYGGKLQRGVYIYYVQLNDEKGETAVKAGKLLIF